MFPVMKQLYSVHKLFVVYLRRFKLAKWKAFTAFQTRSKTCTTESMPIDMASDWPRTTLNRFFYEQLIVCYQTDVKNGLIHASSSVQEQPQVLQTESFNFTIYYKQAKCSNKKECRYGTVSWPQRRGKCGQWRSCTAGVRYGARISAGTLNVPGADRRPSKGVKTVTPPSLNVYTLWRCSSSRFWVRGMFWLFGCQEALS